MTSTTRRMVAAGVGVVLLAAAGVWAAGRRSGGAGQGGTRPLPGVPLEGPSGLRLLVADDPTPFVLDVDSGAVRPVTGLPAGEDRTTHVESMGGHAVVVSRRDCRGSGCDAGSAAYLVRHGTTAATPLGAAMDVEWARDGRGVWLLRRQDATHCTLDQVGLDARSRRPTQPLACEAVLIEELPGGLLLYGPAARGGGQPYSALVTADGAVRRLPVVVDGAAGDLVLSTVEPGREVALTDVTLDIWLLDLTTLRWQRLPDMPLGIAPAKPQLRWTADGRLLLLAGVAGEPTGMVAVWRPGEPRLAVRRVHLPGSERRNGFRFAIW